MSWMYAYLDGLRRHGQAPAIQEDDRLITYEDLVEQVHRRAADLALRLGHRKTAGLCADFSIEAVVVLLALLACKHTVALASRQGGRARCTEIACADWVFEEQDAGTLQLSQALATAGTVPDLLRTFQERERPGLVLFTSGSTGVPKASLFDAEDLVRGKAEGGRPLKTMPLLMLDHIGGVNSLFTVLQRGATLVAPRSRQPAEVVRRVGCLEVQALVTTPTFLNLLLLSGLLVENCLPSLVAINYSGEPMPAQTLEQIARALPHVRLSQAFGSTETGILPFRTAPGSGTLLRVDGRACDVRVRNGLLEVRAAKGMLGYLSGEAVLTPDGFFPTGDAVIERGGLFQILGREKEVISVGSEKCHPQEIEDVLRGLDGVVDVVVRGVPHPISGQVVAARFWLHSQEPVSELRRRVYSHCKERLRPFQIPRQLEVTTEPVYNARMKKVRHGHA